MGTRVEGPEMGSIMTQVMEWGGRYLMKEVTEEEVTFGGDHSPVR